MADVDLPEDLVEKLPPAYVAVLDSVCRGDGDDVIAHRLGIDQSAVPSLVRIATAKLLEACCLTGTARHCT